MPFGRFASPCRNKENILISIFVNEIFLFAYGYFPRAGRKRPAPAFPRKTWEREKLQ